MIPALIALGVGLVLAVAYWEEIVEWLSDFLPRIKKQWDKLKKAHAAQMVGKIVGDIGKIMHKMYYQENGNWIEETTTRTIPENRVPAAIRAKIQRQYGEADITKDIEKELKLVV